MPRRLMIGSVAMAPVVAYGAVAKSVLTAA